MKSENAGTPLAEGRREVAFCLHGLRAGKVCCASSCGTCSSGLSAETSFSLKKSATNCSAHTILHSGRMCTKEWDVGCVVPGVGEAAEQLCYWLHGRQLWGGTEVVSGTACATPNSSCIEADMRRTAALHQTSVEALRMRVMRLCFSRSSKGRASVVKGVMDRGCHASDFGATPAISSRGQVRPSVWLAAIVRDQSDMLQEWLLWHLLLGVSHVLLYDNGSMDQRMLRGVLSPFTEAGAVTLVSMPGHGIQTVAYDDAILRARRKASAPFVACWDVDERVVPHGWGCLPDMLAHCTAERKCGGMRLNTRVTTGTAVELKNPPKRVSHTLLQQLHYNVGSFRHPMARSVVKTIVRPTTHGTWKTPHSTFPQRGWCHLDELLKCPSSPRMPFMRSPQTAQLGFILHLQCRTLLDWVVKKSLTGRVDTSRGNTCQTCFASLEDIYEEYKASCGLNFPADKPSVFDDRMARTFMRAVDGRLLMVMKALHSEI